MPTRAIAPLLMSMASTFPDAMILSTCSKMRSSESPFGGSISTHTVNSLAWSFFQNLLSGSRSITGAAFAATAAEGAPAACITGCNDLTASAMARMCAGVVPQQPPRMRTPSAAASRAKSAKYSGDDFGYTMRSPSRLGKPAFGIPLTRTSSTAASSPRTGSSACGPSVQFAPMT